MIKKIRALFKTRPSVVEVFQGKDGKVYFHLKAGNGQITSASQGYSSKSNAHRAAIKIHPGMEIVDTPKEN